MATIVNTLKVVGTSLPVRQSRLGMFVDGAPVQFKLEPGNAYDPLAIAVLDMKGGHLGYIGRSDTQRERIRAALANGFVVTRATVVGGFRKYDGSYASYGLRVQWYAVDSMYKFADYMDKETEEDDVVQERKQYTSQKPKRHGKEWRDVMLRTKRHHKARYTWHEIEAIKAAV